MRTIRNNSNKFNFYFVVIVVGDIDKIKIAITVAVLRISQMMMMFGPVSQIFKIFSLCFYYVIYTITITITLQL